MSGASWLLVLGGGALFALINALHCAGMCGAFALAAGGVPAGRGLRLALYLAGKTCTYVFLGALAGAAGARVATGAGPVLGLVVGAALLLAGWRLLRGGVSRGAAGPLGTALARALAGPLSALRGGERRGGRTAAFSLGALTGLLPCGVSWLAMLQAAALGGPARGAVFLASFGAGTAPALLAIGWLGGAALSRVGAGGARRARLAGGSLLVAAGLLALLRAGWSLGSADVGTCPSCPP